MTNQEKLLSAFKDGRFDDFVELLQCQDIDVDYFYGEPDNGTLLDLASRAPEQEHEKYISKLIRSGAKLWRKDEDTGKLVIHEILKSSDQYLLHEIWNDIYVLSRSGKHNGNIMKVAVEENDFEAITLLARSYSIVHDEYFGAGSCTQNLILLRGNIDAVQLFIKYFDVDKEFQKDSEGRVFTCREIILQKYPQLEAELPKRSPSELQEVFFSYLMMNVPKLFVKQIDGISTDLLNSFRQKKTKLTYLHFACKRNYIDVVDALLRKNVDLNAVAPGFIQFPYSVTPVMLAASKGHWEIFHKLAFRDGVVLQSAEGSGSVWHAVLRGMQCMQNFNRPTDGYRKILELVPKLSQCVTPARLSIEHKDKSKRTALHYALKYNNEFAIKLLLTEGAKLYTTDHSILTSTSATIIESYFDDCFRSERDSSRMRDADDNLIIFDYKIFTQLDLYSIATKSNGLFFARFESVTEMKKLYKHPLTKSWLYLKWRQVRKYYYINLAFYLSFCLALSTCIFQIHHCPLSLANFNSSESTDGAIDGYASSILCDVSFWMWSITLLLYVVLTLRELCQFSVSIREYVGIPENWFEITMIVVIGFFFANYTNTQLAATSILMSWIEFILLLGKKPSLSIYIEMFKTVALNFAKFLLLYSILIASFAYSFFILFGKTSGIAPSLNRTENVNSTKEDMNENSLKSWQDLQISFFKSFYMMASGFDASNLPLDTSFSYGHVFLILFIFLVIMVLHNLLNGLAVSDTQAIREDAEIVALISRAKLITQIERIANRNPFRCNFKRTSRTAEQPERECMLLCNKSFCEDIPNDETKPVYETSLVYVYPTESNRIEINGNHFGKMPSAIVKHVERIVEKRKQSKSAKNVNWLTDVTEKDPPDHQFAKELVHQFGKQMNNLKLEIDAKNAVRDEKLLQNVGQQFDKMMNKLLDEKMNDLKLETDAKIFARDEKLLQNVDQRFDNMMNKLFNEKISDLKLETEAKNAARDEKLLQNVDQRFDKMMDKLLDAVSPKANLVKNKDFK